MIGPHHSIICNLISTGHGAAAWIAHRCDDKSNCVRSASGSFSMRTNIVGTHWLCVTLYCSMNRSASIGSNASMQITVPPSRIVLMQ